jgi:uncharacterized membrane protein
MKLSMPQNDKPNNEMYNKWHNDPSNWKLGIFYFNSKDKRLFPPKRLKMLGWTVNFANPISILTILLIIIILTFLCVMIK